MAETMNWPIKELREFYSSEKIAVSRFKCGNQKTCDQAASAIGQTLHHGSEAHVGSLYGSPFGIVVVSLSEKDGSSELSHHEEVERGLSGEWEGLNPHMNGTLAILESVLAPEISGREVFRHFALTRAAKCCLKGSADKPPDICFLNCRQFVIPELDILEPRLVIAQGREARWALENSQAAISGPVLHRLMESMAPLPIQIKSVIEGIVGEYFRTLSLASSPAILVRLVHPSDRGGRWALMERLNFPGLLGSLARRLAEDAL